MGARDHSEAWLRFLAAEAAGRSAEAETALATLFAALPPLGPASGFADRVMARIAAPSLFARRPVRFALAAALALAALSAALLAPMALPIARLVSVGDLVLAATHSVAGFAVFVASGLAAWETVGEIVSAVGRALVHPSSLPFVMAQFVVAALALRGLVRVAGLRRSSNHAVLR